MTKTLILLRHAHRDRPPGVSDNGLSEKGQKQAERILKYYERLYPETRPLIVCSPKKRCRETVGPLSSALNLEIEVMKELDEGAALESRVRKFISWWKTGAPELVVACSHGDWIPVFLKAAAGITTEMEKGGWAELELESGSVRLRSLVQSLKF